MVQIPRAVRAASALRRSLMLSSALLALGGSQLFAQAGSYTYDALSTEAPDQIVVRANSGVLAVAGESLGSTDGTSFTYSGTLAHAPLVIGTVEITVADETFTDDGAGYLEGNEDGFGTIDYTTGAYTVTYGGMLTEDELLATADGSTTTFSGTFDDGDVRPGTVRMKVDELQARDDGAGAFWLDGSTGTVTYSSGTYAVTFWYPPADDADLTVEYYHGPPAASLAITADYDWASTAGRDVADLTANTIEAAWFGVVDEGGDIATAHALQSAIGAAERREATLLLPAGTIEMGYFKSRVNIRHGHITIKGSGTLATEVTGDLDTGSGRITRAFTVWDTASHVTFDNLKIDMHANHRDFPSAIHSEAEYLTVRNCYIYDSTAMSVDTHNFRVDHVVQDWTEIVTDKLWEAVVTMDSLSFTPGDYLEKEGGAGHVRAEVFEADDYTPAAAALVVDWDETTGELTIQTDQAGHTALVGGGGMSAFKVHLYEYFTRSAIENGASHFLCENNTFVNAEVKCGTAESLLDVEDVQVLNNDFIYAQAYPLTFVTRQRSDGFLQKRTDMLVENNLFLYPERATVYVGIDWGRANTNGLILKNIIVRNNEIRLNRYWDGRMVFLTRWGYDTDNIEYSDNEIYFDEPANRMEDVFRMLVASGDVASDVRIVNNTFAGDGAGYVPRFEKFTEIFDTDQLTISNNAFEGPGLINLENCWGVDVSGNLLTDVNAVLDATNCRWVTFSGNVVGEEGDWISNNKTMLRFRAEGGFTADGFLVSSNAFQLVTPSDSGADIVYFNSGGSFGPNLLLLDNNVITGGTSGRHLYDGGVSVVTTISGQGEVASWMLDENFGTTATDGTANALHGTITQSSQWTSGLYGSAIDFDGSSTYIEIPDDPALNLTSSYSLSAWIKPDTVSSQRGIIAKIQDSTHMPYAFLVKNGALQFNYNGTGGQLTVSGGTIVTGLWQHVAATVDSSHHIKLYIDGQEVASDTLPGDTTVSDDVVIGAWGGSYGFNSRFNGVIDEIEIFDHALSTDEVLGLANLGGGIANWRFEENSGSTTKDYSGNGHTGTITSATWTTGHAGGNALYFDGSSARITIPDDADLQQNTNVTFTAWIKPETVSGGPRGIVSKIKDTHEKAYALSIKDGELHFSYYGLDDTSTPNHFVIKGGTIVADTWQHVTAVVERNLRIRLYVDGVEVATAKAPEASSTDGTDPVVIGAWGGTYGYSNLFRGVIDDVQIYSRALVASEIAAQAAP